MNVQEMRSGFEVALESRTPFVVRGVAKHWGACNWTLRDFDIGNNSDGSTQYWHHLPQDRSYAENLPCPDWLGRYWQQWETRLSLERPVRFWESPKGHQTPWHYDGNALDVINVQLRGSKRFSLSPPSRELPWVRFQPISTLGCEDTETATLEVTLSNGDLIFIPRFWNHRVRALDEVNCNVNWVWTDSVFIADSAIAKREAERLSAVRRLSDSGRLDTLLTAPEADYLRNELQAYGGQRHEPLVSAMLSQVTPERAEARICTEMSHTPIDRFISGMDPRSRRLLVREFFGATGYPQDH